MGIRGTKMTSERKRAKITNKELKSISEYVTDNCDMQRTKLAEKIQAEVKWPGKPPEIEVLERLISKYRKHPQDNPLDKPWCLAALDAYPIPPDALPVVLEVWKFNIEKRDTFTIREAKWAARLSGLLGKVERLSDTDVEKVDNKGKVIEIEKMPAIERLSGEAFLYAREEFMSELAGLPNDSTRRDRQLIGLEAGMTYTRELEAAKGKKQESPYSLPEKRKGVQKNERVNKTNGEI
jgi:hypothetical protein